MSDSGYEGIKYMCVCVSTAVTTTLIRLSDSRQVSPHITFLITDWLLAGYANDAGDVEQTAWEAATRERSKQINCDWHQLFWVFTW